MGVPQGNTAAAEELAGILTMFTPVIEAMVTHDMEIPPIAIPAIDLGVVTPGFTGTKGRFNGQVDWDAPAARITVQGKLVTVAN